jgi:hypothetical protein
LDPIDIDEVNLKSVLKMEVLVGRLDTPLTSEGGGSDIILMACGIGSVGGISLVVSPFQKRSGWTSGQNFDHVRNLVRTSLGLYFPST